MRKRVFAIQCTTMALIASLFVPMLAIAAQNPSQSSAQTSIGKHQSTHNKPAVSHDALQWRPTKQAKLVGRSKRHVKKYPIIVRKVVQVGGIRGNLAATRTVDGRLSTHIYRLPAQSKPAAVVSSFQKQLTGKGYQAVFQCSGKQCGPHFAQVSPGARHASQYFSSNGPVGHYFVAEKSGPAFDRYVVMQISAPSSGKPHALINHIRTQPLQIASIHVSAHQMAQSIHKTGRVALYGIYFATNSAQLQPKSKPTLTQIAKLLANNPKLNLLVVGHTDSRGSFQYNMKLSRRRAKAVVNALVNNYGVDRSRLKPWGDGYTAPRATNRSKRGRARNRRVELVPR